ncbi:MAG: LytR/AlgR family response regulator transcription factor, partial [Caulobacteraceae bacterium]
MTTGGVNGTSGWPRVQWGPWLLIAAVGLMIALVNATSELLEAQRDGDTLDPRAPLLWEFSSYVLIVALAPLIGAAVRRLPPRRENWPIALLAHFTLTFPFSAVHVAGMVAIRKAGYALAGSFYDFSHGALAREFFYEWRKDVLTYALLAATYFLFHRRAEAQTATPEGGARIEIRDGGAAVFLASGDVTHVEAAGNYVEFHALGRTHLVRGTLGSWEARLIARGFVRVHRSRLV